MHPPLGTLICRNSAYHNKQAKLYEIAKIYLPVAGQKLPNEPKILVLGTYGAGETFFTLKGELEAIFAGLRIGKVCYDADSANPSYHPGRCAKISANGETLGYIGQIHPLTAKNYGMDCEVYCAEINMDTLFGIQLPEPTYVPLPKYPSVSRDLAVVCDEEVTVAALENVITSAAGKLLRSVRLFDIYRGVGIADGKKSLAFALEFRADDRTLTDEDTEKVVNNILKALSEKLNAVLR